MLPLSRRVNWILPVASTLLFGGLFAAYYEKSAVAQPRALPEIGRLQPRILAVPIEGPPVPIVPDNPVKVRPKVKAEPGTMEVHFADDSVLKLVLREEKVEIVTRYGKLLVPVADIQRIEFATRLSETDAKRIPILIANLGSPDFPTRDAASAELLKLEEKAYPALVEATKHADLEVVRRATEVVDKIREAVPSEHLAIRPHDVIHTEDSKFTGRIVTTSLKAQTTQFGEVQLKLMVLRSMYSPSAASAAAETAVANIQQAPASLMQLQNQIGQTFTFKVTGTVEGSVWGTDVYTLDSTLGTAAVHAGVLKQGQTGTVKIRIVPSPPFYPASQRNGVNSGGFNAFPAAYQFVR